MKQVAGITARIEECFELVHAKDVAADTKLRHEIDAAVQKLDEAYGELKKKSKEAIDKARGEAKAATAAAEAAQAAPAAPDNSAELEAAKKKLKAVVERYNEMKKKSKEAIDDLKAKHAQALASAQTAGADDDALADARREASELRAKVSELEAAGPPAPSDDGALAAKDKQVADLKRKLDAVVDRYKTHKAQGTEAAPPGARRGSSFERPFETHRWIWARVEGTFDAIVP